MQQSAKLTTMARYTRMESIIKSTFHIRTMAKIVTGSFWRDANKLERQEFVDQFSRITTATYVSQFNGFSGQSFQLVEEKPGPQNTILVHTQIIRPDKEPVLIIYVVKRIKQKLGIVDILLGMKISELAKKRSEYRQLLEHDGFSGLIKALKLKSNQMLSK